MSTDFNETPGAPRYRRPGGNSFSQLMKNPIFKLVGVVVVIAGAGMAAVQFMGPKPTQEETSIPVMEGAAQTATAGTEVTPEYDQAIREADQRRVTEARAQGDTAVPSVIDAPVMNPTVDASVTTGDNADPLREFEALVRQNEEPPPPPQAMPQPVTPQAPAISPEAVQALAGTYRAQMDMLMNQWTPTGMDQVSTGLTNAELTQVSANDGDMANADAIQGKIIAPAGSTYYAHMLMEANSDVPGPIMAQVLTGPFAGAKVIGSFQTFRNHLMIRFQTIAFRNKEYTADILAVDPDTTLGGVVTEVDPRFMQRALLPAAAAFVKAYGETISKPSSTVTVTGSDTTTTSSDENTSKDAMYAGIGEAADRIASFADEEAAATKRLVRVAVGTPIGLFFVKAVRETDQ